jgi:hypothetical protein
VIVIRTAEVIVGVFPLIKPLSYGLRPGYLEKLQAERRNAADYLCLNG